MTYDAKGRLTGTALSNGLVQSKFDGTVEVRLTKQDGVFHVKGFDAFTGKRLFWETSQSLQMANTIYDRGAALAFA